MPAKLKRAIEVASEKGASTWLTALSLEEHIFFLNKGEFHDALHLRYRWQPSRLLRNCVCSKAFTVDHSMICPYGVFPTLCRNELCDTTTKLLTEVCHNVGTEPILQPLFCNRDLPTVMIVLAWILWQIFSGDTDKIHFLM